MRASLFLVFFHLFLYGRYNCQTAVVPLKSGDLFKQDTWVIDTTSIFTSSSTNTILVNGASYHKSLLQSANGIPTLFFKNHLQEGELTTLEINKLESKIKEIISTNKNIDALKVVFIDLVTPSLYAKWRSMVMNNPPIKSTNKYKVNYYLFDNKTNADWIQFANKIDEIMFVSNGGFVLFNSASNISSKTAHTKSIKGKLLTLKESAKMPLINAEVYLIDSKTSDSISRTTTDKYGDFELEFPLDRPYTLSVLPATKDVNVVILTSQKGIEIAKFTKTATGFTYKLILPDIHKLEEKEEEDISLKFNKFEKSKNTNLTVSENILYESEKFELEKESYFIVDKVIQIMKNNPTVKLEIISHTDARGSDSDNLRLSEKRADAVLDYLVSKGIEKNRLKALGKGEVQIRNRCTNDVSCSDKEHEYNRRTEFHFQK